MMSNSWTYTLAFRETDLISEDMFSTIVDTLNSFAYSIWTPSPKPVTEVSPDGPDVWDALYAASFGSPRITGMNQDGLSQFEFRDLATAQETLCAQGGLLNLWKDFGSEWYEDIHITFRPKSGEISFGVSYDLWETRDEDLQKASDLKGIFITLCQRLEPFYGYSANEYRLETILNGKDFAEEWASFKTTTQDMKQPPILFWLNYFSSQYFRQIGEHTFKAIPHRKENLEQGVLIYLAEYPWDAKMATLKDSGSYTIVSFGK
jgi:hypothetical protein